MQGCPTETPQKAPIWLDKLLELISWQQPGRTVGTKLSQDISPPSSVPSTAEPRWVPELELIRRPGAELGTGLAAHRAALQQSGNKIFYGQDFPEHSESVDVVRFFLEQTNARERNPSCLHLQTQTGLLGSTFCCARPQELGLYPL